MTEEVTDAMANSGPLRFMHQPATQEQRDRASRSELYQHGDAWLIWVNEGDLHNLAMRSASNSPMTNGEVSEPRQTHCADPDCTGPKPHVAETAGCKWGNPRAASDGVVERIIEDLRDLKIVSPVLRFMGIGRRSRLIHEIHELANEAAAALAALSTPTKASADDDPETAKGGE